MIDNNEYVALPRDKLCKDDEFEYISNGDDCEDAAKSLGLVFRSSKNHGDDRPKGCFLEKNLVYFNTNTNDIRHGLAAPICKGKGNIKCLIRIYTSKKNGVIHHS